MTAKKTLMGTSPAAKTVRKSLEATPAPAPAPAAAAGAAVDPRDTGLQDASAHGLNSAGPSSDNGVQDQDKDVDVAAVNAAQAKAQEDAGAAAAPEVSRPRVQLKKKEEMVRVTVPKAFRLNADSGEVAYAAGTEEMPLSHAEHWYSEANGVVIKD